MHAPGPKWYVVQTNPRTEFAVEKAIKGLDFETLLPLCSWERHHNHRLERVSGPLFPCYLFARFDVVSDPWVAIIRTNGQHGARAILGAAENAGIPQPVPEPVMAEMRRMLDAHQGEIRLHSGRKHRFHRGEAIRVLNGPFSGLRGIVERDQRARVKCLLDIFSRQTEICFPRESIALAATA